MHGTFGSKGAPATPVQALGSGQAATSSTPAVGKSTKPGDDPRTKPFVEG